MGNIEGTKEIFIGIYQDSYGMKRNLKLSNVKKFPHKVEALENEIKRASKSSALAPLHFILAKYLAYGRKAGRKQAVTQLRRCVTLIAEKDYEFLKNYAQPDLMAFMNQLKEKPDLVIKPESIESKYQEFTSNIFRKQMMERIQSDPIVEFEQTRNMERMFYLHIGPTNSGKTHDAIERLKSASHGIYLSPLRLLALEIHDVMMEANVPCEMITGEEHIWVENPRVISQTIETADLDQTYDIAVIDEAQMLQDEFRGHAWVRAIMGLRAKEIHLCGSGDSEEIIRGIIKRCGDKCKGIFHERKTPLVMDTNLVKIKGNNGISGIEPGDAFIVFSKKAVLDMAARLEMSGVKASVIYGHLPPEIRKNEVRKFTSGKTQVVVSTDAIGMGINLPIRRIVFVQTQKYDGKTRRNLSVSEVKQIAGRAGRYGMYEEGLVTATSPEALRFVELRLAAKLERIESARLSFPKMLLEMEKPLDEILNMWASIPAIYPYKKMAVTEMTALYSRLKMVSENFVRIARGDDKMLIYQMVSCPLDIKNECVLKLWENYCMSYSADISMEFPSYGLAEGKTELERWENYYKLLDLYHNFSLRMGKIIETERLQEAKEAAETRIIDILGRSKKNYIKRCVICGKVLPLEYMFGRCSGCRW